MKIDCFKLTGNLIVNLPLLSLQTTYVPRVIGKFDSSNSNLGKQGLENSQLKKEHSLLHLLTSSVHYTIPFPCQDEMEAASN